MNLASLLQSKATQYNTVHFIAQDPISIPHRFSKLQDIEIATFFTATFAWGRRVAIMNSANKLLAAMDNAPFQFVMQHTTKDREKLASFVHRTFQTIDLYYFLDFLNHYYTANNSLETAFSQHLSPQDDTIENALIGFHQQFFSLPNAPKRTQKHIPTPAKNSTCKRLCMLLRWLVRPKDTGVDFGLWTSISPSQLVIPMDVHVIRIATKLGLLTRPQNDWKAALELTTTLRQYNAQDPVLYDFALFGMGVEQDKDLDNF